ncbi:MAG TPA: protein-L-isoaspartate O-methyltransferase [Vitreimonas sp.]|uniref:protein-L-isoaspartate O-methyltransferase family protein n=1 Tax=Vitreimonas sp. TaxID=3069702 RepID=UPI002D4A8552|nr:protein-L-isoaspartate O-methyltransferase [Vitreimonas sp.]HYD86762.1 protein-L-isoaspartate O-methyltransferase [Vitreimonas sp.]
MDLAQSREIMVESQVRTADVTDTRILRAMRHLPRERFAPAQKRAIAYADLEIEVGDGRFLMRPRDLAKLIQAIGPQPGERGLEIAGATGYGAAVLAACCREVISQEPDGDLSFAAHAALESAGVVNVKTVSTAVVDGWKDEAPYDVILLNGSAEFVPDAWLKQLAPGGRLGVILRQGPVGAARIYTRSEDTIAFRIAFDAFPPLAPGLAKPRGFSF